jgi:predicted metal-dependent hydrolase
MAPSETIRQSVSEHIQLNGRSVEFRVVRSQSARKLRIKVSLEGIQVVLPKAREQEEARNFLRENGKWVTEELDRTRRMNGVRRPEKSIRGEILLRGERRSIKVVRCGSWRGPNRVTLGSTDVVITCGPKPQTAFSASLENWLRREARHTIEKEVADVVRRVKRTPNRIYVMGQRTKWGNCSALGNLSFNWRLIMAPEFVLRYIVTHEVVHLAIPDHSQRFWLTVQSLCPLSERARQWLAANAQALTGDLSRLF